MTASCFGRCVLHTHGVHPQQARAAQPLTVARVEQLQAVAVQVLPNDECLHGTHLQARQRVLHAKHVLARVLADLVEEAADEALFLHKLDVGQHVCRQLDRLVEAVLAACRWAEAAGAVRPELATLARLDSGSRAGTRA